MHRMGRMASRDARGTRWLKRSFWAVAESQRLLGRAARTHLLQESGSGWKHLSAQSLSPGVFRKLFIVKVARPTSPGHGFTRVLCSLHSTTCVMIQTIAHYVTRPSLSECVGRICDEVLDIPGWSVFSPEMRNGWGVRSSHWHLKKL